MNAEHGDVSIKLDNNIIIVDLVGSFNLLGAKKYTNSVKHMVEQLNGLPFLMLVNLMELVGGTPEAYKEVDDLNDWLNQQNLVAKARVSQSVASLSIVQALANSTTKQTIGDFPSYQEAIDWLKSLA